MRQWINEVAPWLAIIAALNVDSLINNAIKGAILLIAIVIQVLGPQLKGKAKKKA